MVELSVVDETTARHGIALIEGLRHNLLSSRLSIDVDCHEQRYIYQFVIQSSNVSLQNRTWQIVKMIIVLHSNICKVKAKTPLYVDVLDQNADQTRNIIQEKAQPKRHSPTIKQSSSVMQSLRVPLIFHPCKRVKTVS